jgi:hypothetical protein
MPYLPVAPVFPVGDERYGADCRLLPPSLAASLILLPLLSAQPPSSKLGKILPEIDARCQHFLRTPSADTFQ